MDVSYLGIMSRVVNDDPSKCPSLDFIPESSQRYTPTAARETASRLLNRQRVPSLSQYTWTCHPANSSPINPNTKPGPLTVSPPLTSIMDPPPEESNPSLTKISAHAIPNLPPGFYYIPNFLTPTEETSLLHKLPAHRWTHLTHRRLQAHPSTLTASNTLLAAPLPVYLTSPIVARFQDLGVFDGTPHRQPNHVLVNEYRPGEGIMPHEDGEAYAPVVATVSLGAALCLDIYPKTRDAESSKNNNMVAQYALPTRILQERRSLLVTMGDAYTEVRHGIAALEVDERLDAASVANWGLLGESSAGTNVRGTRVSLTYRDVVKVSRAASKVFGTGRR